MAEPLWKKFGMANLSGNDGDYKFELYVYTSDPITESAFKIIKDVKERIGSTTKKKATNYFAPRRLEFSIIDTADAIFNILVNYDSNNIYGKVTKNSVDYFYGKVSLDLNKFSFLEDKKQLKMSIYDGISKLKEYEDFSIFSSIESIGDLFYKILAKLGFSLNVLFYWYAYKAPDKPSTYIGIPIAQLVRTGAIKNYYELLELIAKSFDFTIFQEGACWKVRQNYGMVSGTIRREEITSAGALSSTTVSLTYSLSDSYLAKKSIKGNLRTYNKIAVKMDYLEKRIVNPLGWLNENFEDTTGWVIDPAYAEWSLNALKAKSIDYTYSIYAIAAQSISVDPNTPIKLDFNVTTIRMILSPGDAIRALFFAVKYEVYDSGASLIGTYYLEFDLNGNITGWGTTAPSLSYFQSIYRRDILGHAYGSGAYMKEYDVANFSDILETATPTPSGAVSGKLTVYLYGGGKLYQSISDYPAQEMTQWNKFNVIQKTDGQIQPNSSNYIIEASSGSEYQKIKVQTNIKENDPHNEVCLYYNNSGIWEKMNGTFLPDSKEILEILAERLFLFNFECDHYYDLRLLPGYNPNFNNLINYKPKYYLIVYKERSMKFGDGRYIIIKHEPSATTPTIKKEYIY